MRTNIVEITETAGGWDASVSFDNGFAETIEGLYDFDSALSWAQMHVKYENSKYTGRRA